MAILNFTHQEPVVPSNTLAAPANLGLLIGGGGDVSITTRIPERSARADGTPVWVETTSVIAGVPAGTILPLSAYRINATGTTATGILALR
jgi:hypothetical protein